MEKKMINKILAIVLVCGMLAGLLVPGSVPARAAETTTSTNLALDSESVQRINNLVTNVTVDNIQRINDGDRASAAWIKTVTNTEDASQEFATTDYVGYTWETPVTINEVVLYTSKAATEGPFAWHVQVSDNGSDWRDVEGAAVIDAQWYLKNVNEQSRTLQFLTQENVKALRVCIDKVHSRWNGYLLNEVEVYNRTDVTSPNLASSAVISPDISSDATLGHLKDTNYDTGMWRNGSISNDYYEFEWTSPISVNRVNLVVWKALFQAPTAWRIEVLSDGATEWKKVSSISGVQWEYSSAIVENKSLTFEQQTNVKKLRVYVGQANNSWNGYGIQEIEIYHDVKTYNNLAREPLGVERISNLVGHVTWIENMHNGVWDDGSKNLWVTTVTNVTNGTTEEFTTNDYLGYTWTTPVTVNEVVLVTSKATTQGPCAWHIAVTTDGATWKDVDGAKVTDVQWQGGDQPQAKTLQFETQEDIVGLRVHIDKVHSTWNGYLLNEIEVYYNPVSLKGSTAALDGTIDMNFFFDLELSDAEKNSATTYASFSVPGVEEQKITVSSVGTPDPERGYKFTYQVPAKRMADTITIRFYVNGMPCPDTYEYSVAQYAKALVNGNGYKDTDKQMAAAMLHYGAYSQKYFNHNVENLADKDLPASYTFDIASVTAGSFTSLVSSNVKNIEGLGKILGSSLILESETTLRLYFKPATGTAIDALTFTRTVNGKNEVLNTVKTKIEDEDCLCIDIPNIAAHELKDTLQLAVSNGSTNGTLKYSTLTYGANVLNNSSMYNENLVNLVQALYLYSETARSYKGM